MSHSQFHPSTEAIDAAMVEAFVGQKRGQVTREQAWELLGDMKKKNPAGVNQLRELMFPVLDAAYQVDMQARLAQAWNEGWDAGEQDILGHTTFDEPCQRNNPYQEEQ